MKTRDAKAKKASLDEPAGNDRLSSQLRFTHSLCLRTLSELDNTRVLETSRAKAIP